MLRPGTTTTLYCLSNRPAASLQTRKAHILTRLPMTELVGSYSVPLCSDACSRWIADDKNAHAHNLEVRTIRFSVFLALSTNPAVERAVGSHHSGIDCQVADATRWLLDKVVPDLALELAFRCIKIKPDEVRTYNQGPCSIALRRGNNETGSSRCVPGCSFPSPESKGLAWAYFTSICTTFFIACTPAASTCGACGHTHTHTAHRHQSHPFVSPCVSHSSDTWASCEASSSRLRATIWWTGRLWSRAAGPAPWAPSTPTSSSPRCPFASPLHARVHLGICCDNL
jgi:hypothetical protein